MGDKTATATCNAVLLQPAGTSASPKGRPGHSIAVCMLEQIMGAAKIISKQYNI